MKLNWKWIALFIIVFIGAVLITIPLWNGVGNGWMGMMGGGFQNPILFGNLSSFGGLIMMFGMLLIPLVVIGLAILGVAAIIKGAYTPRTTMIMKNCVHCGKPLQAEWANCPYCGRKA